MESTVQGSSKYSDLEEGEIEPPPVAAKKEKVRLFVFDTSSLIHLMDVRGESAFLLVLAELRNIVIPDAVTAELDTINHSKHHRQASNSRRIVRTVLGLGTPSLTLALGPTGQLEFVGLSDFPRRYLSKFPPEWPLKDADHAILAVAFLLATKTNKKIVLITEDQNMRMKGGRLGLLVQKLDDVCEDRFTGVSKSLLPLSQGGASDKSRKRKMEAEAVPVAKRQRFANVRKPQVAATGKVCFKMCTSSSLFIKQKKKITGRKIVPGRLLWTPPEGRRGEHQWRVPQHLVNKYHMGVLRKKDTGQLFEISYQRFTDVGCRADTLA